MPDQDDAEFAQSQGLADAEVIACRHRKDNLRIV